MHLSTSTVTTAVLLAMGITAGAYAADGTKAAKADKAGSAPKMGFFVSSTGSGKGADLGGLTGADKLC